MRPLRLCLLMTCAASVTARGPSAADPPNGAASFAPRAAAAVDDRSMADEIDRALAAKWASAGVTPAPRAGDAEFLRRVSLDIAGRIPTGSEARAFLDDPDPGKRRALVERLLGGPAFASHMADLWKDLLIPEASGDSEAQFYAHDFEVWLRNRFGAGVGYDRMVRELLTAPVRDGLAVFDRDRVATATPQPFAFLAAKRGKPENLAAGAARAFLGVRLECAQCHDHPFAGWKREEFWGLAAFFAGLRLEITGDGSHQGTDAPGEHALTIPDSGRVVQAAFLDGTAPGWADGTAARAALAGWMTSKDNPYFARATANRVWAQFFGVGLVDPVDDLDPSNEPSHPELLDRLAGQLAAHDFDLKFLIRAVTSSRAYQATSAGGSPGRDGYRLFDRMPVRGLTPAQLYDSLVQAAGLRRESPHAFSLSSPRRHFFEQFAGEEDRPTDRQTSIHQALAMMNGALVADATGRARGMTLAAVAGAPFLDTAGKVEALYLAALTRRPRPAELERLTRYVDRGGTAVGRDDALADVFWSLLVSNEFMLNH